MMPKEKGFFTVKDIAEYLNLKDLAVYRLIQRGELPSYKFGRQIRVKKEDFDRFLEHSRQASTGRD